MAQRVKDFENYDVTSLDYDKSELLVELRRIVYLSLFPSWVSC